MQRVRVYPAVDGAARLHADDVVRVFTLPGLERPDGDTGEAALAAQRGIRIGGVIMHVPGENHLVAFLRGPCSVPRGLLIVGGFRFRDTDNLPDIQIIGVCEVVVLGEGHVVQAVFRGNRAQRISTLDRVALPIQRHRHAAGCCGGLRIGPTAAGRGIVDKPQKGVSGTEEP